VTIGSPYQAQQQQVKNKALIKTITGAVNNGSGLIRITATAHTFHTEDRVTITGVGGTTEANAKNWRIAVITANTFDLVGSTFTNAYTSGGTAKRDQG
jgi:aspartate 1-decarboxylase